MVGGRCGVGSYHCLFPWRSHCDDQVVLYLTCARTEHDMGRWPFHHSIHQNHSINYQFIRKCATGNANECERMRKFRFWWCEPKTMTHNSLCETIDDFHCIENSTEQRGIFWESFASPFLALWLEVYSIAVQLAAFHVKDNGIKSIFGFCALCQ